MRKTSILILILAVAFLCGCAAERNSQEGKVNSEGKTAGILGQMEGYVKGRAPRRRLHRATITALRAGRSCSRHACTARARGG